ncbi:MAG TPA: hypothetical protein VGL98_05190 [Gammaproteobacteria bacterium]
MMKRNIVGAAGVLLALSWTQSTFAQPSCGDLNFTGPISREFPQARDACLDVVEREGRPFAHFQARVRSVRGGTVEAELKMPDGSYSEPISVTPDPSSRVRIGGRSYRWRDLSRGQELDVWVPPDRWEIAVPEDPEQQFAAAPAIAVFVISEPTTTVAANTLPRTASPVPLVGALGAVLAALGFGVAAIRRRFL